MRYLHTMVRVRDLHAALRFFCDGLGLQEIRRRDSEQGRYTLVFLGERTDTDSPQIELTHNWDQQDAYTYGRNFGHLAYEVDDIYVACQRLIDTGYTISRPPRDGRMAFVRSPDLISVELLQKGGPLAPAEPWTSMKNTGEW
jgi:lactoylglutathione lyase